MPNNGQVGAVDEAIRLDVIGFSKFTSKLGSDTFSTFVGSMTPQQEACADPFQKVTMAIEDIETKAVSSRDIDNWLAAGINSGDTETASEREDASPGTPTNPDDTANRTRDEYSASIRRSTGGTNEPPDHD